MAEGETGLLGGIRGFEDADAQPEPEFAEQKETSTPDAELHPIDDDTRRFNEFLSGSDEAFRQLYDAYERHSYLYILRLLGVKHDAEDVFQEVWTRMYRLRGEQKEIRRFTGLLFTIARNLSLNAIRDRKMVPEMALDRAPERELSGRNRQSEDSELRDLIEKALLQLPLAQREAFILREYFGYSYQEMASILSTPMVTAKTRAWRARESMRKIIGAWLELKVPNHEE